MTDITAQLIKIQAEETDYKSAVSEGTMTRIGAAINWLIENGSDKAGDIRASMLTEVQFQAQRDNKWVLMDGRDVTGSDYATLTGNNSIPDARAVVLRGKDNGRLLDPAGDLTLGTYQADSVISHKHLVASTQTSSGTSSMFDGFGASNPNNAISGISNISGEDYELRLINDGDIVPNRGATSPIGSSETRSKAIIVNYFIKINN